jgi:alpha-L-fucosidase 2
MLIQSHAGFIELLPALPDDWKAEGEVKGMKAQGGFTINFAWKDGKITSYEVLSPKPMKTKIKVNGEMKEITSKKI